MPTNYDDILTDEESYQHRYDYLEANEQEYDNYDEDEEKE